MKRIIKSLVFVAVAAMGLTACQNDYEEQIEAKESVVVTFVADSAAESRTSVNTEGDVPVFAWDETESFAVLEQTTALAEATNVVFAKDDEGKATITATFDNNQGQSEYQYVAVYPKAGYVEATSIKAATLSLPASQTMGSATYDPNADLMVSKVVATAAQPTEVQPMQFTRLAAVAKMTIKGVEGTIEKVIFTAEGKTIAGTITADLENIANEDGTHNFEVAQGSDSITIEGAVNNAVYFTLLPTTLEAGEGYTVTIVTEDKIYVKKGTIPDGKSLEFAAGMVTRFGVNMEGVTPGDKWMLVRDVNDLEAGDIVTFAAANYDFVLGCSVGGNYPYASYNTDIVKVGDYLYHPVITDKSKYQQMIQPLVVVKSDENVAAFDFYNGVDYDSDTKTGYLTNAQTNNYLLLNSYPSANSLFYTTIDGNGVASLVAADSEFKNKDLKFYNYNPNSSTASYRRFVCTNSPTANHDDVCIYKKVGANGVVPTAGAVVTVPDEDEPVVIGKEGATGVEIDAVKFNYVGDWTISVSDNADWLTLNYADGKLSYTAPVNAGAKLEAIVTITASHDGEEDLTWSFNVIQKGEPQIATVAEFIGKSVDLYAEYIVTGRLTKKATSHSGSTTVTDLNDATKVATFVYIDNKDGKTFYNNSTDVEVGDIVQFVAPVTSSKTGGSSSIHTIFNGYYNLSATTNVGHVAYSGGEVTVTINKEGNLTPQTITGTVNGSFATVTPNGDKFVVKLDANEGAPREVVATFTDGYATTSITIVQGADTSKGTTWELVTDAATLEAGDKVIIAAKDYDVAMSTTISSSKRSQVAVTKLGNYYITPAVGVQTFVLGAGSVDGTFAFYDATNEGFLVSSSTSYELKNQAFVDENASFAISITDGVASIGNKTGTYSNNKMYYRQGSSYFYSGTTAQQAISLYRLVGVKGKIPVVPADVTVPTENVVVAEEGAAEATAIDAVEFNYVGGWAISVSDNADWLTVNYADSKLTYTAEANAGVVRYAEVTITATHAGEEDLTWTFNVLQKGAPEEITIEALRNKEKDVNVAYKVTGRVVTAATTSGGAYVLEDAEGNQAKIAYLKTDVGENVYGHSDFTLSVGDVVTVTTVVTSTNGTYNCGTSTYPSIYKGHYRLTATAEPNVVSYEGGNATINVALTQNGTLGSYDFPTPIEGTMAASDFATFTYTTGASTANVNFTTNTGASRKVEATFTSGLAKATVTIGQENDPDVKVGWFLVTDVNELAVGDKVIIAAKSPDGTLDYAIKPYAYTSSTSSGVAINLMGYSIEDVTGVEQFTLESGHADYAGTWAFKCDSHSRYIYANSSNVKITSTLDKTSSWTIAIAADGKATLTSKVGTMASSKNTMMFNYTTSNQTFGVYTAATTDKGAIYIYKYYAE